MTASGNVAITLCREGGDDGMAKVRVVVSAFFADVQVTPAVLDNPEALHKLVADGVADSVRHLVTAELESYPAGVREP